MLTLWLLIIILLPLGLALLLTPLFPLGILLIAVSLLEGGLPQVRALTVPACSSLEHSAQKSFSLPKYTCLQVALA